MRCSNHQLRVEGSQAYMIVNLTFDLTMIFRGHNLTSKGHTLYFGTYKSAVHYIGIHMFLYQ